MGRDFFIPGESMVSVKGNVNTSIAALSMFCLSDGPIRVRQNFRHKEMMVDAWGNGEIPVDLQFMLSDCIISFTAIHLDFAVFETLQQEAMAGSVAAGTVSRTGARMGNNAARFAAGNHYIGLNIQSPVANKPYRFWYSYLADNFEIPLGTEKSIIPVTFRAIPYTNDPWGGGSAQPGTVAGTGSAGAVVYDHNLDT